MGVESTTITNLEAVLRLDADEKVIDYKIKRLTTPGENFSSVLLSVDITVGTTTGTKEINTVAKIVPPNEFLQNLFNTPVTFRNEIEFYRTVVPTLQQFLEERNVDKMVDFAPKYYGGRFSLNSDSTTIDSDAVLFLENLKVRNFNNLERTEGFDLEGAKLVLADLAHLHAVPLALKVQKPDVFDAKVKPFLAPWQLSVKAQDKFRENLGKMIEDTERLVPFAERILKSFDKFREVSSAREPFATISHNDCWVNNTMVRLENGTTIENKLVDFQCCDYGSPAKDVIFFLFSSVKDDVVKQYYDYLIGYYYEIFSSTLRKLKCDTEQFSFDSFGKELDWEGQNSQFGHVAFMLFPIFAPKGSVGEISELKPGNMFPVPGILHKEKMIFVVEEFAERNWI